MPLIAGGKAIGGTVTEIYLSGTLYKLHAFCLQDTLTNFVAFQDVDCDVIIIGGGGAGGEAVGDNDVGKGGGGGGRGG